MPRPTMAATLERELAEALDRFVARRPLDDRTQAIEAALAEKVGRLARTLLQTPPGIAANGADGRD